MIDTLYIEDQIDEHPKAQTLKERFSKTRQINCLHYKEVFNLNKQNFRRQKQNPSLILAKKQAPFLFPIPKNYGIGHHENVYFSHMFNCPFDCKYCFLQGLYNSAHYVLFVNFDDYERAIEQKIQSLSPEKSICFFSGYDADSLALENITHFAEHFIPFFSSFKNAFMEIRTKSANIAPILRLTPSDQIIIAYSLNPETIASELELKTASLKLRLENLLLLQKKGWQIGIRFDPLILTPHFKKLYQDLFDQVFTTLDPQNIHSVSLGTVRFPHDIYKKIRTFHEKEPFLARLKPCKQAQLTSYPQQIDKQMMEFCLNSLYQHLPSKRVFVCH